MRVLSGPSVIARAEKLHAGKYTYDRFVYVNKRTKVVITCQSHGDFVQLPLEHAVKGHGCPKCCNELTAKRLTYTTTSFISRARQVHGNIYDYDQVSYRSYQSPVIIRCKTHGDFTVIPHIHLRGVGCQRCTPARFSEIACEWLEYRAKTDGVYIQHAGNQGEVSIRLPNGKLVYADGWCKSSNTIYEFFGKSA